LEAESYGNEKLWNMIIDESAKALDGTEKTMKLKSCVTEKAKELESYVTEKAMELELRRTFWNCKSYGTAQTLELQKKCNWKSYGPKKGDGTNGTAKAMKLKRLRTLEDYGIDYSDCHNLKGFTCKNMPNNIVKNVCKKWFSTGFLRICILLVSKFVKKKFLDHLSTSLKLQSPIRKKRLKILKNVFYKRVLKFLFRPIYPLSFS
jgi:hypothetical protein